MSELMGWVAPTKRWQVRHKGKLYFISCRQLAAMYPGEYDGHPSKEASQPFANRYWREKQKELDTPKLVAVAHPSKTWLSLQQIGANPPIKDIWLEDEQSFIGDLPPTMDVTPSEAAKIVADYRQQLADYRLQAATLVKAYGEDRTITPMAELHKQYLASKRVQVAAKKMSVGRYEKIKTNLGCFIEVCGEVDDQTLSTYHDYLLGLVSQKKLVLTTAHHRMNEAKAFIAWMVENNHIDKKPRNFDSKTLVIGVEVGKPRPAPLKDVQAVLQQLKHDDERMRLYILLMLNCGWRQMDIATLEYSMMTWKAGTVTRLRHKTKKHKSTPTITYKLWPETLHLLEKHRHPGTASDRVLLNRDGLPLVQERIEGEEVIRSDSMADKFSRWCKNRKKLQGKDTTWTLGQLRSTGADTLDTHETHRQFREEYLGEATVKIVDRHYANNHQHLFDAAIEWLGEQVLPPK